MLSWLKYYMPRGLYSRAALILLLPFLALQVIVSIVFIQRHFEDVTEQMTMNQRGAIDSIMQSVADNGVEFADTTVANPLGFSISTDSLPEDVNRRIWYDLSGITVRRVLEEELDALAVDLTVNRFVVFWREEKGQLLKIIFPRRFASARNPHQLLVLMLFVGGFAALIASAFLRNQLRPIRRLARASEAFGRGRRIEYSPAGALEVRQAGNAFLEMRARIERQIEQRTLLLSGVSHDLRTPLTRLRLGLSMLPEDTDVKDLRADVDDMSQMIDAFLEFAREGAEESQEPVDVMALATEVAHACDSAARPVEAITNDQELLVAIRPTAIKRALQNLITNAQRHGKITRLTVDTFERSVRFRVEDDGPGIPAGDRADALKPFMRLDTARSQNTGGSVGLGLAISADIARRHGGSLRLGESQSLGGLQADLLIAR